MSQKQPIIIKKQESTVEQMKISPNHGREGYVFESTEQQTQKNNKIEAKQGRKWAEVAKTPTASKIQNPRPANGKFPGDVYPPITLHTVHKKETESFNGEPSGPDVVAEFLATVDTEHGKVENFNQLELDHLHLWKCEERATRKR